MILQNTMKKENGVFYSSKGLSRPLTYFTKQVKHKTKKIVFRQSINMKVENKIKEPHVTTYLIK
jgi:hypothetical protein